MNGYQAVTEITPKIRILIADGHQVMREGLRRLLSTEKGFDVVAEAADPDTLLRLVSFHQPEVLLVSSVLGGETDVALLRRLEAGTSKTRIIIMTSSTRREDHVRVIRQGASGIMTHETSAAMLAQGIRKVCDGELWVDRRTASEAIREMISMRAVAPMPRSTQVSRNTTSLSKREKEVAALVAQGFKNKEIADRLFISEQTVKNHMHNIFEKLGVTDRLELALLAIHHGLT